MYKDTYIYIYICRIRTLSLVFLLPWVMLEAQKAKSEGAAAPSGILTVRSNVPCQGLSNDHQMIKLSTIHTPIMPRKLKMEFAKVSRKVFFFFQRRWR